MSGFSICNLTSICPSLSFSVFRSQKFCLFKSSNSSVFSLCSGNTHLNLGSVIDRGHDGFCSFSAKKLRNGGSGLIEMESSDDGDDDWEDFGVFDDEDDDEGIILPFEKMKMWLENKPRGFGEGKIYDTLIEDKLLDEITQSKQAQATNLSKLKNNPVRGQPKKNDNKELKKTQNGIHVRVSNLPKKKKIHRDLKSAFEGTKGIISINPAVSGNKKTKDPICRGFAFVDFKTNVDATRFVETFSGQRISFGKVEKQIKFQLMNSVSDEDECLDKAFGKREPAISELEEDMYSEFVAGNTFVDPWTESDEHFYSDGEVDEVIMGDYQQNLASTRVETEREPKKVSGSDLKSQKRKEKMVLDKGKRVTVHDSFQETGFEQAEDRLDGEQEPAVSDLEEDSDGEFLGEDEVLDSWTESDEHVYSDWEVKDLKTGDCQQNLAFVSVETPKQPKKASKKVLDKGEMFRVHDSFQETEFKEDDDNLDDNDESLDKIINRKKGSTTGSDSSERLLRIRALEQKLLARGKLWGEAQLDEPDQKRHRAKKKKVVAKGQAKKRGPKLEIPGSAKKLKVKEKAVLSGVLSKYAAKPAVGSK